MMGTVTMMTRSLRACGGSRSAIPNVSLDEVRWVEGCVTCDYFRHAPYLRFANSRLND